MLCSPRRVPAFSADLASIDIQVLNSAAVLHVATIVKLNRRTLIRNAAGGSLAFASAQAAPTEPAGKALLDVFAQRQSVRKYLPTPVPDEHIRMIIDAARRAPTCMNEQPWKFLVVRDKTKRDEMKKRTLALIQGYFKKQPSASPDALNEAITRTEGYFSAPVFVVVLVDKECQCGGDYMFQDGVLAAGYLLLAARALGYGTVYLTDGVPEQVSREVLNIPAKYRRICMTPIGVPDPWPPKKPKKPLDELIAYEKV